MNLNEKIIIVLGHKGMLGQMVLKYFKKKVKKVITLDTYFNYNNRFKFIEEIKKHNNSIVINCIGKIKQKTDNNDEIVFSNTILPIELTNTLFPNQILIHPSTDCIFDGKIKTEYPKNHIANAEDTYGWSKQMAESVLLNRNNTIIFRVSFIGLDNSENPKGLLSWFLSNSPNSKLKGFTNHFWNGITSLEFCHQIEKELLNIKNDKFASKLIQTGTKEYYSKYDMLLLFQNIFNTKYIIEPFETETPINRKLIPDFYCKPLREQLIELKNFDLLNI